MSSCREEARARRGRAPSIENRPTTRSRMTRPMPNHSVTTARGRGPRARQGTPSPRYPNPSARNDVQSAPVGRRQAARRRVGQEGRGPAPATTSPRRGQGLQEAERGGFEPPIRLPVYGISSAAPSAARTPLREGRPSVVSAGSCFRARHAPPLRSTSARPRAPGPGTDHPRHARDQSACRAPPGPTRPPTHPAGSPHRLRGGEAVRGHALA